ncbi:MAG: hypothetical protein P1P87_10225 [Trueperaceae bacterium]|nr:hypothetical protein [Trueperaceae bacterium]
MTVPRPAAPPFVPAAIRRAWALLALRPLTLLAAQALVAALLAASGATEAWWSSAAWWPVSGVLANVIGGALLMAAARAERLPLRALVAPAPWRRGDVLVAAVAGALLVALATLVPVWHGTRIWGDPSVGTAVLAGPLPAWAAWGSLLLFPVTTALVDVLLYAGYVRPRLAATRLGPVGAVLVVGAVLGVQVAALPFLPARTFVAWRLPMLVPYGLALLALISWRPRLLPAALAVAFGLALAAVVPTWLAST